MYRRLIVWANRFFTTPIESLDEKAENLFKAFEGITEGNSPASQAKIFEVFSKMVKNHFETREKIYKSFSDENIKRAIQFKEASESCFPTENKCN